jgi:hypothetical protein
LFSPDCRLPIAVGSVLLAPRQFRDTPIGERNNNNNNNDDDA